MGTESQPKYADLLGRSEEEVNKDDLIFRVKEAEQQVSADILATEKKLATSRRELAELESSTDYNPSAIIEKEVEVEGYVDGLMRLERLKGRHF